MNKEDKILHRILCNLLQDWIMEIENRGVKIDEIKEIRHFTKMFMRKESLYHEEKWERKGK